MTAIVGILNKRAVAIAADSAVTVTKGDSKKIYNTSQKIFKLSDRNPIAVMTYDNVEFMETPVDVIIDMYRTERGDKTFKKVSDYCDDFLDFISSSGYFSEEETQRDFFLRELYRVYDRVMSTASGRMNEELAKEDVDDDSLREECLLKHIAGVLKDLSEMSINEGKAEEFKKYSYERFIKYTDEYWDVFEKEVIEKPFPKDTKELFQRTCYEFMTSELCYSATGLVFIGYGSRDIYPSLHSIYISGIFDGKLRYFVHDHDEITNNSRALIQPFAQDDVMMTMMKGIAPEFHSTILGYHSHSLEKMKELISDRLRDAKVSGKIIDQLDEVDFEDLNKEFSVNLEQFISDTYVDGIIDAVDSFNVEDMANMAESLISITNLQRHFSSSEESVGGPVEVAVITRNGGFKWVKHRQW